MYEINFDDDPRLIWASQSQIAVIFGVSPQNITWHIRQIYGDAVLPEEPTCKESLQVCIEGGKEVYRTLKLYNFDMIIEIGNRINTASAKKFRKWLFGLLVMYLKSDKSYIRVR